MEKWRNYLFWTCKMWYLYKCILNLLFLILYPYLRTKSISSKMSFKKVSWNIGIKGDLRTFYCKRRTNSSWIWTIPNFSIHGRKSPTNPGIPLCVQPSGGTPIKITFWFWIFMIQWIYYLEIQRSSNEQGKKFQESFSTTPHTWHMFIHIYANTCMYM